MPPSRPRSCDDHRKLAKRRQTPFDQEFGRHAPAVAVNQHAFLVDQERRRDPEGQKAVGYFPDLLIGMQANISGIWPDAVERPPLGFIRGPRPHFRLLFVHSVSASAVENALPPSLIYLCGEKSISACGADH